jgi:hypothetical protein
MDQGHRRPITDLDRDIRRFLQQRKVCLLKRRCDWTGGRRQEPSLSRRLNPIAKIQRKSLRHALQAPTPGR